MDKHTASAHVSTVGARVADIKVCIANGDGVASKGHLEVDVGVARVLKVVGQAASHAL